MSATVTLQQRIQQLKKIQADLGNVLYKASKKATKSAIRATANATPPKKGTGRLAGVNMLTGELKQHWATDSRAEPQILGKKFVTLLANDLEYASYVNDGHRLDRHFVPGLYIDENGQLNYDPTAKVGLIVGTKTKYVKGEFMVDKGKEEYSKVLLSELDKEIGRLMK